MVFKILKAAATFHGVDYNEKKQKNGLASNIYFENFGFLNDLDRPISKSELKHFLKTYSEINSRITKPQFHAILSCKGNANSFDELKELALGIMHRLGYEDVPILIYEHRDTSNNHIHIVTSRVGLDGKKISDHNEGRRAHRILNELIQLQPKQEFEKDLTKSLSYRVSTISQFVLLMERAGYKKGEDEKNILFYKHGVKQGAISKDQLTQKILSDKVNKAGTPKIKALIYKYAKQHDTALSLDKPNKYTTAAQVHRSELTDYLQKTFGLEFVFFASKDHSEPYGYTVIDHDNKTVYKGSEIISLQELKSLHQQNTQSVSISTPTNSSSINNEVVSPQHNSADEPLSQTLDAIINSGLQDNESYYQKEGKKKSRKNKLR